MSKTPLFYLVSFFIFLNIVDMLTTIFILPGESNPLYLLTGSFITILIIKILVMILIIVIYRKHTYKSTIMFYGFICVLVYGSIALTIAQIGNIYGIFNPAVIAEGASMSKGEKANYYYIFMSIVYLLPIMFSMVCFWIYDKSIKVTKIKKPKKVKLWKFRLW